MKCERMRATGRGASTVPFTVRRTTNKLPSNYVVVKFNASSTRRQLYLTTYTRVHAPICSQRSTSARGGGRAPPPARRECAGLSSLERQ